MSSLNKVMLIGRLGKDPEMQYFESGAVKAAFSLATSERYKNREGQQVENTEWHNLVLWGKSAEIAEKYLRKGKQVYVEGSIKTRSWEAQDGSKRYMTEINVQTFKMLGSRSDDENNGQNSNANSTYNKPATNNSQNNYQSTPRIEPQAKDPIAEEVDDLPF
ncbi:MAG: single-stranded DNA-binding protein [Chitinophagales bacterium]